MAKRSLRDMDVAGKRVLARVDFNVPIEQGVDHLSIYDHRLKATLPTIQYLLDQGAKVILCSHLGRPDGKVVEELRLKPVGERLSVLLARPVTVLNESTGLTVESSVNSMSPGDVVILENIRFHPGEEKNDQNLAKALGSLADLFVMDAFAVAHRAHASVVGVPRYLPSAAGFLLQQEIELMGKAMEDPARPLAAVLGGAKVHDKILVLENLLSKIDKLFIGGGMAVTFLKSLGRHTGASAVEEDKLDFASQILQQAERNDIPVYLPEDVVVASQFSGNPPESKTVGIDQIPPDWYVMDIGRSSARKFVSELQKCKTVIWNGPMGVFEFPAFTEGTRQVGEALAALNNTTIVGGGSTAEAVEELGLMEKMTLVSTGGGAALEFLEGKILLGVAALPDKGPC